MTALLPATSVAADAATSTTASAPSEPKTTAGPGRIENLSNYIENPGMFEQNREPTHVTAAVPYQSVQAARHSDESFTALEERWQGSDYFKLLDGDWNFQFFDRPTDRPRRYTDGDWDTISVPGVWQLQGYDELVYLNTSITWDADEFGLDGDLAPGEDEMVDIPDVNPTATYRKTVSIPSDWNGREIFVHFEGVKQAYFVWVDDQYVGFQQGSMTPGEFDITDYVSAGSEHEVTVQVYRFSDGEALETIDMFRYSGIFRSVYLYSTPSVHLRDFYVRSDLDDDYEDGHLRIDGEIANYTARSQGHYQVSAHLYDPSGSKVTTLNDSTDVGADGGTVTLETTVTNPEKWSAEHPNLYTVVLELISTGSTSEAMLDKVGFRSYETTRGQRGAQVLVNGEPVTIRGTNRHETDPDSGRTLPIETMQVDLERMKQFNVNAVRTSHYPNDPSFLRLADEYGIYIMDEVNVETHWWEGLLAHTEAYHDQAVARFRRMVLRDRNHASIFAWSTGNEAGTGAEHLNMAALAMDTSEYLPSDTSNVTGVSNVESFEGSVQGLAPSQIMYHQPNGGGWNVDYSDMLGPRYPDVDTLLSVGDGSYIGDGNRPVVMGEYNHAMGNSLGLVHEMWSEHIQPPTRQARDETGNGNNGVLVGTPAVEVGNTGGAVTLDDGDSIDVGTSSSLDFTSPGFTIAVSFKELDPHTAIGLLAKGDQYSLATNESMRFVFSVGDSSSVTGKVPANLSQSEWHTLVGVCSGDRLELYLDGDRIGATTHSITEFSSSDQSVRVGYSDQKGVDGSTTIDSAHVFERALSAREISDGVDSISDGAVLAYSFSALLRDKSLAGGFVWDWVNQDVTRTTTVDGEEIQYQFYDDDPFCLNGLVWSDREAQPELLQLKHSHQPVKVAPAEKITEGEIYVTNHFNFTDLSTVDGYWELVADDEIVQSGSLSLDLNPGETRRVTVPLEVPEQPEAGTEYWLNFSFTNPEATLYADAGHEVARDQLEVPFDVPEAPERQLNDLPALSMSESKNEVVVAGDGFEYTFDKGIGTLTSMQYAEAEVLETGPRFNAWRAPIMNEVQSWGSEQASSWREAGLQQLTPIVDSVRVSQPDDSLVQIHVEGFAQGTEPKTVLKTPDTAEGNDGIVYGNPETVEGRSGKAIDFDGEDDYVDAGNSSILNFDSPGFSISVTFKGIDTGGHRPFISKGDHQYALKINDTDFEFFVYSGTWIPVRASVPSDLSEDEWHTLTGVCSGSELQLYLDGQQLSTIEHNVSSVNTTDYPVHVAHNAENSDRITNTSIDSVRIYDRALSASEVASQPNSPPESAVLWYGFDEFSESKSSRRGSGFETTYRYRVFGNGDVAVGVNAAPNSVLKDIVTDYLPKMGLQLEVPDDFTDFEWYGRGPEETYPDRKWGVNVGRYSGAVDEQYVPYLPPTDNGNKADTRWAALSNGRTGLLGVATDTSMNVSLNAFSNLAEAEHQHDLKKRGSVAFNLDHAVSGVGGTPVEPISRYQVQPEPANFQFVLRPFVADGEDPMRLAKSRGMSSDDS